MDRVEFRRVRQSGGRAGRQRHFGTDQCGRHGDPAGRSSVSAQHGLHFNDVGACKQARKYLQSLLGDRGSHGRGQRGGRQTAEKAAKRRGHLSRSTARPR